MVKEKHYLVVGAGFSGAVLARELAENGRCRVKVIDRRSHLAGNCHTERDVSSGVMVHCYGPHIFNTNNPRVWDYVNRFGCFRPFVNRVKAVHAKGVFSLPINLHTINQFFGKNLNPSQARAFIETLGDRSIAEPKNFEEQALRFIGRDLYEAFFYGYTFKQWGCEPRELPASILKRLPVRFNYDDNYYNALFQGIPESGYTAVIENILDHPAISVELGIAFHAEMRRDFDQTVYTGPLDEFFGFEFGRLGYRTVTFEKIEAEGDYQGNAVLNYPGRDVAYTRVHEHKHFAPWEKHEKTVAFREFSKETEAADTPYYPKRLKDDLELLRRYRERASREKAVSFLGRLATYRYMDMEAVIGEALEFSGSLFKEGGIDSSWPIFPNRESI